jgi:hypothetical protein
LFLEFLCTQDALVDPSAGFARHASQDDQKGLSDFFGLRKPCVDVVVEPSFIDRKIFFVVPDGLLASIFFIRECQGDKANRNENRYNPGNWYHFP